MKLNVPLNESLMNYTTALQVGLSILLISSVAIGVMSGITIGATVWVVFSPQLMATASLMPLIGFLLGYLMSTICKQNGQ